MLSVVVCTCNRASSLGRTLQSLRQMSVPANLKWELIVVDNNSTDGTRAVIEEFARTSGLNVRYIFEPKQGLSYARNAGVGAARGEIIAFTDDDVTVDPKWIRSLRQAFTRVDCTGASGRTFAVWPCEKPAWFQADGPYAQDSVIVEFDKGDRPFEMAQAPIGVNMAYRRAAFEKYGLFRTDLGRVGTGLLGGEDTELGRRVLRAGEKIFYAPEAVVYHPVDAKRMRKGYFQSHYFEMGKAIMREELFPPMAVKWFGVPRYFFRELFQTSMKWLSTLHQRRRFFYKLSVYRLAGKITEARRLSAEVGHPVAVHDGQTADGSRNELVGSLRRAEGAEGGGETGK
jgi:glucosyl-dolichyl phosphate glucuronosyltransferase